MKHKQPTKFQLESLKEIISFTRHSHRWDNIKLHLKEMWY